MQVRPGDRVRHGAIETEFVHINHSVAGACALALRTPVGTVFHTGDFKFDQTPIDGKPADFAGIARIGDEGVLCMLSDSTNAERPGHTLSERIVGEAFTTIFSRAKGRILIASFASNVPRIQQAVDHAVRFGRKVAFLGRSMLNVVHFASELGHLRIPPETVVKIEEVDNYPPERVRGRDDRLAGRADERARAHVGARPPEVSDRSGRYRGYQRDARFPATRRASTRRSTTSPSSARPSFTGPTGARTFRDTRRKKSCC